LVAALTNRLGVVLRVSLALEAWDDIPRAVTVDGRTVQVGRFRGADHSLGVTVEHRDQFTLLVVPPRTDEAAAVMAMTRAVQAAGYATAEEVLAASGTGRRLVLVPALPVVRGDQERDRDQTAARAAGPDTWTTNTKEIAVVDERLTGTTDIIEQLRLGTGFTDSDRVMIASRLAPLAVRLRSFRDQAVELELSVKDRSGTDPRVTLECWIASHARLVATSKAPDLQSALTEVRDDLSRQIDDVKGRRESRNRPHAPSAPTRNPRVEEAGPAE
jgi:ribosome-associated translation inhibitor RaiA